MPLKNQSAHVDVPEKSNAMSMPDGAHKLALTLTHAQKAALTRKTNAEKDKQRAQEQDEVGGKRARNSLNTSLIHHINNQRSDMRKQLRKQMLVRVYCSRIVKCDVSTW